MTLFSPARQLRAIEVMEGLCETMRNYGTDNAMPGEPRLGRSSKRPDEESRDMDMVNRWPSWITPLALCCFGGSWRVLSLPVAGLVNVCVRVCVCMCVCICVYVCVYVCGARLLQPSSFGCPVSVAREAHLPSRGCTSGRGRGDVPITIP